MKREREKLERAIEKDGARETCDGWSPFPTLARERAARRAARSRIARTHVIAHALA